MLETLLSGTGFAVAAGLNAPLTLLILALADRTTDDDLGDPWDAISSNGGIIALLLLLPIELIVDKVSRVDHFSNLVNTLVRPLAGAAAFAAIASLDGELNAWLAGVLGFVVSGAVHAWKLRTRPSITVGTKGIGTPVISMMEDVVVVIVCLVSAFFPLANIVLVPALLAMLWRSASRMQRGESKLVSALGGKRRS